MGGSDISLGIRLKFDGRDVSGGVTISREQFRQLAAEARKTGDAIGGGMTSAARGVRSISEQLDQARNAVIGYFGATQMAGGARWIIEQASAMRQLEARVQVATANVLEHARATDRVFAVANRWGAAVDQTAGAYARLNPVIERLGGTSATTLKMLDGLGAGLRLSGASAAETSAVLQQFSQAMGSGRVGGDEFRSMMENAEPVMRAVAEQLGTTTSGLRDMAEQGTLTSSVFANALLPAVDKLVAKAEKIPLGVSQAWQVLENNLSRDFGREFAAQGDAVAGVIKTLSGHTTELAAAVHAAGDGLADLAKVGATVGAAAGGVWMAKQAQAARDAVVAYTEQRAATAAATAAIVAEREAELASIATSQAWVQVQRERATAQLAAANATLHATRAMGVHSAALAANAEAAVAHRAAIAMLADTRRMEASLSAQQAAAQAALSAAQTGGAASAGLARTAVAALGGPLGMVLGLLGAGATAWALWGSKAEDSVAQAEKAIDDMAKRRQFGANPIVANIKSEIALLRAQLATADEEGKDAVSRGGAYAAEETARLQREIDKRIALLQRYEQEEKKSAASTPDSTGENKPLSSAGEWGKLTESLKWREKIIKEYGERSVNLNKSYADRIVEATKAGKATDAIVAEYRAASRALADEQRAALESLPDAKETRAVAEASADARVRAAEETSKRLIEVLTREHEAYEISTQQMIDSIAAAKTGALEQQIAGLRAKLASTTKESERIPLREKIRELQAALASLPEETRAALDKAEAAALEGLQGLQEVSGKAMSPLEQAGQQFARRFGELMQRAAADGREDIIEAGRAAWSAMANAAEFETAKTRFAELTAEMAAELEMVRDTAARDGGVLAAIGADTQAEDIRRKFIPALRDARAEMERTAGTSPINGKTVTEAGRAIERVSNELSPFWEKFFADMHSGLTNELFRQATTEGRTYGESFVVGLTSYLKTAAIKIPIQLVGDLAVGTVKSAMGFNTGPGSAMNGYNMFSNMGMSPAFDSYYRFATSSFGQSAGLSETLYLDDAGVGSDMLGLSDGFSSTVGEFAKAVDAYGGYVNAVYQLSQGNYGSAAGAAIGQYVGGPIGSFIGATIGGFLDGGDEPDPKVALTNSATQKRNSVAQSPFGWLGLRMEEMDEEQAKLAQKIVQQLAQLDSTIADSLRSFELRDAREALADWKAKTKDFSGAALRSMGFERLQIVNAQIDDWSADAVERAIFSDRSMTGAEYKEKYGYGKNSKQALVSAYSVTDTLYGVRDEADFEGLVTDILDGGAQAFADAGESTNDTLVRLVKSLDVVNDTFDDLGYSLYDISSAGADAASELIDAFGGLEQFASSLSAYFNAFYSQEEKSVILMQNVSAKLADMGLAMPGDMAGYRAMVEEARNGGPATQDRYVELVNFSPAVAAAFSAQEQTMQSAVSAVATAQGNLSRLYDQQASETEALIDRLGSSLEKLRDYRTGLLLGDLSPMSLREKASLADAQWRETQRRVGQGDLDAIDNLQSVGDAYLRQLLAVSTSREDYMLKAASVIDTIGAAESVVQSKKSDADLQLSELKLQVGELIDINKNTADIATAITALLAAQSNLANLGGGDTAGQNSTALDVLTGVLADDKVQYDADQTADAAANLYSIKLAAATPVVDAIAGIGKGQLKLLNSDSIIALATAADAANDSVLKGKGINATQLQNAIAAAAPGADVTGVKNKGKLINIAEALGLQLDTIKGFAVGIDYVPHDMFTKIHAGERVFPAADNRALMDRLDEGSSVGAAMAAMAREIGALRGEVARLRAAADATATNTGKFASDFMTVTEGGRNMRTKAA